jgi:hypothetical protein
MLGALLLLVGRRQVRGSLKTTSSAANRHHQILFSIEHMKRGYSLEGFSINLGASYNSVFSSNALPLSDASSFPG